jgi:hypothetical protein
VIVASRIGQDSACRLAQIGIFGGITRLQRNAEAPAIPRKRQPSIYQHEGLVADASQLSPGSLEDPQRTFWRELFKMEPYGFHPRKGAFMASGYRLAIIRILAPKGEKNFISRFKTFFAHMLNLP